GFSRTRSLGSDDTDRDPHAHQVASGAADAEDDAARAAVGELDDDGPAGLHARGRTLDRAPVTAVAHLHERAARRGLAAPFDEAREATAEAVLAPGGEHRHAALDAQRLLGQEHRQPRRAAAVGPGGPSRTARAVWAGLRVLRAATDADHDGRVRHHRLVDDRDRLIHHMRDRTGGVLD